MDADKEKVIKNLKIGVTNELYKKQLITQRQLQYAIELINIEYHKKFKEQEGADEKSCGILPRING